MTARYRIVHFVADPFTESRVPIAALVNDADQLSVVRVRQIPGPKCLGGRARSATVQMILEDLAASSAGLTWTGLPFGIGPHAILGSERSVPDSVTDPVRWVENLIQPPSDDARERRHRAPWRATYGYQFFKNYNVANYVKKTFKPGVDLDGFLHQAHLIGSVSHYVANRSDLLLLEPIVPSRDSFNDDVGDVAKLFGAYKSVREADKRKKVTLVAYVLAGGLSSSRNHVLGELGQYADDIIDTSAPGQRDRLIHSIREIGASEPGPLLS